MDTTSVDCIPVMVSLGSHGARCLCPSRYFTDTDFVWSLEHIGVHLGVNLFPLLKTPDGLRELYSLIVTEWVSHLGTSKFETDAELEHGDAITCIFDVLGVPAGRCRMELCNNL